jgi:hypothetical protein
MVKKEGKMQRTMLIIFLFFFFVSLGHSQDQLQKVTVHSDKELYAHREGIEITLRNDLSDNIFSHAGSDPVFSIESVEKKDFSGNWEKLFAYCQYPHCIWDMGGPEEIASGQSVSFVWEPRIAVDGKDTYAQAGAGTYRLLILYQIRKGASSADWEWLRVYSNEFAVQ